MKRVLSLMSVIMLVVLSVMGVAFGAEVAQVATPVASPNFMTWIMANGTAIAVVLLAISEFLALIPGISGNGILDSIIKILRSIAGRSE